MPSNTPIMPFKVKLPEDKIGGVAEVQSIKINNEIGLGRAFRH